MTKITLPAYAKINLFLEITNKRQDGYHDLDMIMHSIDLCDMVTVEINNTGKIEIVCPKLNIENEKNIAYKACKLYFDKFGIDDGAIITIEKHIPWEAGLGGGSSDAAAVFNALNSIYKKTDTDNLASISSAIGSDIPFCICGGCMRATKKGEVLSRITPLPECCILIAKGSQSQSTAKAYALIDQTEYEKKENKLADIMSSENINFISDNVFNRFDEYADYATETKDVMKSTGALTACLCGSGSAVFGIYTDKDKAMSAQKILISSGEFFTQICKPHYDTSIK